MKFAKQGNPQSTIQKGNNINAESSNKNNFKKKKESLPITTIPINPNQSIFQLF